MKMKISAKFIAKAGRDFGEAGSEWVNKLPGYISLCQEKWQLTHVQPLEDPSINYICYAHSRIYGDVVLKLQAPHAERKTELAALQLFAGRKVCKLHEFDEGAAALLLERILPGVNLRSLPDKKEQLEIGAELIAQLPVPVGMGHGFPTYQTWIRNALENILPQFEIDQRLFEFMHTAEQILGEICPPGSPQYLLHGDLHHDNILQNHQERWKVIDPHGVVGLPFMESARFIQNHVMGDNGDLLLADLDATINNFAVNLAQPKRLISSALFILHSLSTCWDVEMNYPPNQISTRIDECEYLWCDLDKFP
jgi:streptomycin 6-kinase